MIGKTVLLLAIAFTYNVLVIFFTTNKYPHPLIFIFQHIGKPGRGLFRRVVGDRPVALWRRLAGRGQQRGGDEE